MGFALVVASGPCFSAAVLRLLTAVAFLLWNTGSRAQAQQQLWRIGLAAPHGAKQLRLHATDTEPVLWSLGAATSEPTCPNC